MDSPTEPSAEPLVRAVRWLLARPERQLLANLLLIWLATATIATVRHVRSFERRGITPTWQDRVVFPLIGLPLVIFAGLTVLWMRTGWRVAPGILLVGSLTIASQALARMSLGLDLFALDEALDVALAAGIAGAFGVAVPVFRRHASLDH